MSDSAITVVMVMLAAVLIFVFPVIELANKVDKMSQLDVETLTSEFASKIRVSGALTQDSYGKFYTELNTNSNVYDVELEFKILDENPGKKSLQTALDKIGENTYYSVFTSQIEDVLNKEGIYLLKEGDIAIVTVRNASLTMAQQFKNNFYKAKGSDMYTIATSQSALIIATGSKPK